MSGKAAEKPGPEYIPPASIVDVLFEQLAYLLAHNANGEACASNHCATCSRLSRVATALMIPFSRG
jgi:hypothetical protein